jgi:hypothetical protein
VRDEIIAAYDAAWNEADASAPARHLTWSARRARSVVL